MTRKDAMQMVMLGIILQIIVFGFLESIGIVITQDLLIISGSLVILITVLLDIL